MRNRSSFLIIVGYAWSLAVPDYGGCQQPGSVRWRVPIGNVISPISTQIISSPAIGPDGTIYIGTGPESGLTSTPAGGSGLYTFSPQGATNWIFTTRGYTFSSPAIGPDGTVYIGSTDESLYSVAPTGSMNWKFATAGRIPASPALGADGTIYVNCVTNLLNRLYSVRPDGTLKWFVSLGAVSFTTQGSAQFSSPAVGPDGTIYVGSMDKHVYAISPSGTTNWIFPLGAVTYSSPAVGRDGTIYIAGDDHNVYALGSGGSLKWKYATASFVECSPAIDGSGNILIGSLDGNFYALDSQGNQKWSATMGLVSASPAIGADGTIYVASFHLLTAFTPLGTTNWSVPLSTITPAAFSSPAIAADGTLYLALGPWLYAFYGSTSLQNSSWSMFREGLTHTARSIQRGMSDPTLLPDSSFSVTLTLETNVSYRLQASSDLANWSNLVSFSSTNFTEQFIDTNATGFPLRFYRLASP